MAEGGVLGQSYAAFMLSELLDDIFSVIPHSVLPMTSLSGLPVALQKQQNHQHLAIEILEFHFLCYFCHISKEKG